MRSTSSSSQDEEETTEFITSFGGEVLSNRGCAQDEDFDDEGSTAAVHGPALPSAEFRRILFVFEFHIILNGVFLDEQSFRKFYLDPGGHRKFE